MRAVQTTVNWSGLALGLFLIWLGLSKEISAAGSIDRVQKHNLDLLTKQLNRGWHAFCKCYNYREFQNII